MAPSKRRPTHRQHLQVDGALCVSFVNTGSVKRRNLESYTDLLAWGVGTGALSSTDSQRLTAAATASPGKAAAAVVRAKTQRRRLERILVAIAAGNEPEASDFELFNSQLRGAMAARQLVAVGGGHRWTWGESDDDFDRMLWPVLLSAADILTTGGPGRDRQW